jgi:hypothetical protein
MTPLAIITAVHILGLAALLWTAFAYGGLGDEGDDRDEGRGGLPRPPTDRPGGGPPLADAAPSRVRLRGPSGLGALAPRSRVRRGPTPRSPAPARATPARRCAWSRDRLR